MFTKLWRQYYTVYFAISFLQNENSVHPYIIKWNVQLVHLKAWINEFNISAFLCGRFFFGVRGLNPGPCIYYALPLSTELSSRGLLCGCLILSDLFFYFIFFIICVVQESDQLNLLTNLNCISHI
jgi:hypothetical protein